MISAVGAALDLDCDELDPGAALLLVALAEHYSPSTGRCWPSVDTLCRRSRQNRRTVQKKLKLLEDLKLIRRLEHFEKSGRQLANSYFLTFLNRQLPDTAKLEPEIVMLQGVDGGEGADFAPSLFDEIEAAEEAAPEAAGEGANLARGGCLPGRPGASVGTPPTREPSDGTTHLNPPAGRTSSSILIGRKSDHLERAARAIGEAPPDVTASIALEGAGFRVDTGVKVSDRGDGRGGRIPLVARKGLTTIVVAIDEAEIRPRDLARLACVTELVQPGAVGYRLGVVKRSAATVCPAGLDALVVLDPPKRSPSRFWVAEDDPTWPAWCRANGHAPTLSAASSEHRGRKGWWFKERPDAADRPAA